MKLVISNLGNSSSNSPRLHRPRRVRMGDNSRRCAEVRMTDAPKRMLSKHRSLPPVSRRTCSGHGHCPAHWDRLSIQRSRRIISRSVTYVGTNVQICRLRSLPRG